MSDVDEEVDAEVVTYRMIAPSHTLANPRTVVWESQLEMTKLVMYSRSNWSTHVPQWRQW